MAEQEKVSFGWAKRGAYLSHLWTRYKINGEIFDRFWKAQEGKCSGCKVEFAHPLWKIAQLGVKPEVDHKHYLGKDCEEQDVRGLLCRKCNDFLGKIQDNQEILKNLREYLRKHGDFTL